MRVCDVLVNGFPALFDMKFTARMEEQLDTIAGGNATYLDVMRRFYRPLSSALRSSGALSAGESGSSRPALKRGTGESRAPRLKGKKSDVVCDKCGSPMELRKGNYGYYLACLGFPKCRNIVSATEDGKVRDAVQEKGHEATGARSDGEATGVVCDKCGSPMVRRSGKNGEFYGCSNYPTCRNTRPVPLGITCPLCGQGDIVQRVGGRYQSVFYGCTRYPDCRFTSGLKPVNKPCSRCGNSWLTEAWSETEGNFLECPKCKAKSGG
jgi:DNA topoisomerase-1